MKASEGLGEVLPPRLYHTSRGRQFRLVHDDGRVVVVEEGGWYVYLENGPENMSAWYVYLEDDPENMSAGSLDGLHIAEVLGYKDSDDYPDRFDEWTDQIKAAVSGPAD